MIYSVFSFISSKMTTPLTKKNNNIVLHLQMLCVIRRRTIEQGQIQVVHMFLVFDLYAMVYGLLGDVHVCKLIDTWLCRGVVWRGLQNQMLENAQCNRAEREFRLVTHMYSVTSTWHDG